MIDASTILKNDIVLKMYIVTKNLCLLLIYLKMASPLTLIKRLSIKLESKQMPTGAI